VTAAGDAALPRPRTEAGAAGLAALLADPGRAVVALDFDGTLAPIVARPEDARPASGAMDALAALAEVAGTVAVVTGRAVETVLALSGAVDADGLGSLVVLGHYGLEQWDAASGETVSPRPAAAVETARTELGALLEGAPDGVRLEDKHHSLVVHTRNAARPDEALAALQPELDALGRRVGLESVPGRRVLELRPPGVDKGGALRALVDHRDARAVLFAGDDLGDLPAFDAVESLRAEGVPGLTVASASDEVVELAERADLQVDGPAGVVRLLRALAAATGPARP
jgi:trehalose 6-phosphate phosphatase